MFLLCPLVMIWVLQALQYQATFAHPKQSVLIVTSGRSGSSFLGEIFNNHPDVMYYYEPIISMNNAEKYPPRQSYSVTGTDPDNQQRILSPFDLLHSMFSCNVSEATVDRVLNHPRNVGRRLMSKFMSRKELCDGVQQDNNCWRTSRHHTFKINARNLNKLCRREYSHVAIKELHGRLPTGLKGLLHTHNNHTSATGLKIIQLVRDPRGVFQSMGKVGWVLDKDKFVDWDKIEAMCDKVMADYNYGNEYKQHFMAVRYEDLCENFISTVKRLLDFVGLSLTKSYGEYLQKVVENEGDNRKKPFNLDKNMKRTFQRWRTDISPTFANGIEKVCGGLMNRMGYTQIKNKYDLLKDTNVKLTRRMIG